MKMLVSSVIMGVFTKLIYEAMIVFAATRGTRAIILVITIVFAMMIYLISCTILKVDEVRLLINEIKRKIEK